MMRGYDRFASLSTRDGVGAGSPTSTPSSSARRRSAPGERLQDLRGTSCNRAPEHDSARGRDLYDVCDGVQSGRPVGFVDLDCDAGSLEALSPISKLARSSFAPSG
jgi:hypothetical protein